MILEFLRNFATTCSFSNSSNFLSFPTWYEYLQGTTDPTTGKCTSPSLVHISDVWLIVAAVIDILLRLVAILAVVFIVYGGIQYIVSQGSPERTDQARKTVISAVIGLVISLMAAIIIGYLAKKLGG